VAELRQISGFNQLDLNFFSLEPLPSSKRLNGVRAETLAASFASNQSAGHFTRKTGTAAVTNLRKLLGKRVFCGAFAALVAATTLTSTSGCAAPRYDGLWSVSVVTEKGDCDPGYRYPIRISNGQLVNAGNTAFTISGKVAPTGAIIVTVAAAGKSATGSGHLAGDGGGGHWTGGACSGSWTAERRGA
jgi:hypothetical protein